jgi:hypothetical protein
MRFIIGGGLVIFGVLCIPAHGSATDPSTIGGYILMGIGGAIMIASALKGNW